MYFVRFADIVREILENRAEIYKALNKTPRSPPSEEEEGPTQGDIFLADHLKLQKEISEQVAAEQQQQQQQQQQPPQQ